MGEQVEDGRSSDGKRNSLVPTDGKNVELDGKPNSLVPPDGQNVELDAAGIIELIGFGKFHKKVLFLAMFLSFSGCARATITVFLLLIPNYRCAVPGLLNDTYKIQDEIHQSLVNDSIPDGDSGQCHTYAVRRSVMVDGDDVSNTTGRGLVECNRWVYDESVMTSTLVSEFNVVCDQAIKIPHATMVYFAGVLVGASMTGTLGDIFGRRLACVIPEAISVIAGLGTTWVQSYTAFMVLRFITGVSGYLNLFGIVIEIMQKSRRVFCGTLMVIAWPVGGLVTAVVAYLIRDWRYLQLAMAIPTIPTLAYYWVLPESIRWLVDTGRLKEAELLLLKIAKENNVDISNVKISLTGTIKPKVETIINIVVHPKLLVRLVCLWINWAAISMVYYGLTLNAASIGGNVFVNFALSNFVEVIGYSIIFFGDMFDRKKLHISLMFLTGTACVLTTAPVIVDSEGLEAVTICLSLIGKLGISAAFQLVYVYTPELFPTSLRLAVLGSCSCLARVGSMAAPYIAETGQFVDGDFAMALPLVIFGGYTILSSLLCLLLPETRGVELPATIEAAKRMNRNILKSDREMVDLGDKKEKNAL